MNWVEIITLLSSLATTVGVFFAWYQIRRAGDLHRTQFEDSLSKEYRELIPKIPIKVFIGKDLTPDEYDAAKPVLFHYLNLTNDQIFLRSKKRISEAVWNDWRDGIEHNLKNIKAIRELWGEIKENSKNFYELRKLEENEFVGDPAEWDEKELKSSRKLELAAGIDQ